jgi:hypothetical protein
MDNIINYFNEFLCTFNEIVWPASTFFIWMVSILYVYKKKGRKFEHALALFVVSVFVAYVTFCFFLRKSIGVSIPLSVGLICGILFYFDKKRQDNKMDDEKDKIQDRLSDMYRLQDGGKTSKATPLGATVNVAVEYALPTYRHLKFGLLSTTRIQGNYSWNEERLAVTVSPAKMFEVSANAGVGTLGANVGWIINFHPRGFNLFLGSDHCIGKLSKQGIPLRSNYDVCVGINYPIGKSRIPKESDKKTKKN